jgi:hypothetical protein
MRTVSFLAIAYMFLMLAWPCQDVFAVREGIKSIESPSLSRLEPCEDGEEFCSPFCICSCCGLAVTYHTAPITVSPDPIDKATDLIDLNYGTLWLRTYSRSVWQPPKH